MFNRKLEEKDKPPYAVTLVRLLERECEKILSKSFVVLFSLLLWRVKPEMKTRAANQTPL